MFFETIVRPNDERFCATFVFVNTIFVQFVRYVKCKHSNLGFIDSKSLLQYFLHYYSPNDIFIILPNNKYFMFIYFLKNVLKP